MLPGRRGLCLQLGLPVLLLLLSFASGRTVILSESGWSTGLRESTNLSMDLSGFSLGSGSFSRYAEISKNEVKVRDRTSSSNGTLDLREEMHIYSNDEADWLWDYRKYPGNQDYYLRVYEAWPVYISAARTLDFSGSRINDLEYFGNNFEYAGSSHRYATELRKDTAVNMVLKDVRFFAVINKTTNRILKDEFLPNLTLDYTHRSSFQGMADFKYRHSENRKTAAEGEESYIGAFTVFRRINSTAMKIWPDEAIFADEFSDLNFTYENRLEDLGCCPEPCNSTGCRFMISQEVRRGLAQE